MKKVNTKHLLDDRLAYYSQQAKGFALSKKIPASGLMVSAGILAALPPASVTAQICGQAFVNFTVNAANPIRPINFDQDGDNEFGLRMTFNVVLQRFPSMGASSMRTINGRPTRLAFGAAINATQPGMQPSPNSAFFTRTTYGNWLNQVNNNPITGYWGISFLDFNNNRHYGWVELEIRDNRDINNIPVVPYIKMLGWAYNTVTNGSITAGQTTPAGACLVLPVELTAFKALAEKDAIRLIWETATEHNNAGFQIERSDNETDFKEIGFVEGSGTSSTGRAYQFEDKTVRPGKSYYYRLRQIDNDGSFKYSNIIQGALAGPKMTLSQVFPNPVPPSGAAHFNLELPQESEVVFTIFDLRGIAVYTERHSMDAGTQEIQIDMKNIPSGTYFIKAEAAGASVYQKLVRN